MTVVAVGTRQTTLGENPGTFLSFAPQHAYQAKAVEALLQWHNYTKYAVLHAPSDPYAQRTWQESCLRGQISDAEHSRSPSMAVR